MDITLSTRALIPSRLIADAAHEGSRRALGRLRAHVKDIRVTLTDRRLDRGTTCCQVELDLARGTAVVVRSKSGDPVEAVSQAFDKAARGIVRCLRLDRMRHRAAHHRQ